MTPGFYQGTGPKGMGDAHLSLAPRTNGTWIISAARLRALSPRLSYLAVTAGDECPANACTDTMSAPASSMSLIIERRRSCGENVATLAFFARRATSSATA